MCTLRVPNHKICVFTPALVFFYGGVIVNCSGICAMVVIIVLSDIIQTRQQMLFSGDQHCKQANPVRDSMSVLTLQLIFIFVNIQISIYIYLLMLA